MIDRQQRLQDRLIPEIEIFRKTCQSLQLATLSTSLQLDTSSLLEPHVSYAPFAHINTGYFILISDITEHGQNLKKCPFVSAMMIQDESAARSIYARCRLSFESQAKLIDKSSMLGQQAIGALHERFGEIITQLSGLDDFNLYQLVPIKGRYVKGFGQAFELTGDELLNITPLKKEHVKQQAQQ